MRNPIAVLKSLEEKANQKGYVFERLYRNLYNPEFYLLAYPHRCGGGHGAHHGHLQHTPQLPYPL